MQVPPAWYKPPKELDDDSSRLTVKKLFALLLLQWWHVPNIVTELRVVGALGLIFTVQLDFGVIIHEEALGHIFGGNDALQLIMTALSLFAQVGFWSASLFILTAITDKLDGFLARGVFGKTQLGAVLDPLVDKLLMLIALIIAMILCASRGEWAIVLLLFAVLVFLWGVREPDVTRHKVAAAKASNEITSARQSGRVSMVVFCVALAATLLPIVGFWSMWIKMGLIVLFVAFSTLSWFDYRREYGKFLK